MVTGTVTNALRKLYKAIVGVDISRNKNNPTKIINELADNWPEGVTIEALTVTENDTYTAPEGKAYSPVTVNVSGGSSDFSTAEVTFISTSGTYSVSITQVVENHGLNGVANAAVVGGGESGTLTFTVPLYKGYYAIPMEYISGVSSMPVVTGNLELTDQGLMISGDGTFTAEGA